MLTHPSPTKRIHYVDYKVEGTRVLDGETLTGWRITTVDQSSEHEREYWVRNAEIFLVDLLVNKPWNHATPFIIGTRATRISPEERQAIHRAIAHWSPAMIDDSRRRKIKVITEGVYVGVGVRRTAH